MGEGIDLEGKNIGDRSGQFICPDCHMHLIKAEDEGAHICKKCDAKFIIRNDIHDLYPQIPFAEVHSINFAELYQILGRYPMAEQAEKIRRDATLSMVDGGRILEIGCATGLMTEHLAKRGDVYATDISMSYLKKVRTRVSDVTLVRVDAHKLPFDGLFFDNVLVTDVLEHVLVPYRVMEEIHRVLKPKGKLILGMPNILNLSNIVRHLRSLKPNKLLQYADAHISFYDPAGLFQLLAASGFEVKKYQPIYPFSIARNIIPQVMVKFFDKLFGRITCYFSREMLVVAQKSEKNYWATLKTAILRKKALLLQNKHG
jgi:ubiquinone/menaquinone biosynthesis C-methylase UbiE